MVDHPKSKYNFAAFETETPAQASLSSEDQREVYKLGMEGSFFPIKKVTSGVGSIFMLLFFSSIFLVDWINSNILFFLFFALALAFAVYSAYLGFKAQSEIARYIQFSKDNNLSFKLLEKDFTLPFIPLLDNSFDTARYKIFSPESNQDYTISNFRFRKKVSTKNGTRTETYWRGIIALKLPKSIPHILVLGEKDYTTFHNQEKIRLGAGVDGKIKVYAPKSLHREILLILTPDVLEALVDNTIEGEIHIEGKSLVFVFDKQLPLNSPETWEMFDRLQETIGKQLLDQIDKYRPSSEVAELLSLGASESVEEVNETSKDYDISISLKKKRSQINVHPIVAVLIFGIMSSWILGLIFIVIL